MGTWGPGGFENDTALDWMAGVSGVDDVAAVFTAVEGNASRNLEGGEAEKLIAAAECVAAMRGFPSADLPTKYVKVVAALGTPSMALVKAARAAVGSVLQSSELIELWAEAGAGVVQSIDDVTHCSPQFAHGQRRPQGESQSRFKTEIHKADMCILRQANRAR